MHCSLVPRLSVCTTGGEPGNEAICTVACNNMWSSQIANSNCCTLHMCTSIKGIMELVSSLLATSHDIDGASSSDESQRDEGSSSSALKII